MMSVMCIFQVYLRSCRDFRSTDQASFRPRRKSPPRESYQLASTYFDLWQERTGKAPQAGEGVTSIRGEFPSPHYAITFTTHFSGEIELGLCKMWLDAFFSGKVKAKILMPSEVACTISIKCRAISVARPRPSKSGKVKYAISTSPLRGGERNAQVPTTILFSSTK